MSFLGPKLKDARNLLKKTQSELANDVGISQKEVSRIESGKRPFIPNTYMSYLYENGIDLNSIIDENKNVCLISKTEVQITGDKALEMICDLSAKNAILNRDIEELKNELEVLKREKKSLKSTYGHVAAEPHHELVKPNKRK